MPPVVVQPKGEREFQQWYAGHAKRLRLDPDPDAPEHFYDYRAAFKSGAKPDDSGHWPSAFKLEGHPRMVIDGINTKTGQPVGGKVYLDEEGNEMEAPARSGREGRQAAALGLVGVQPGAFGLADPLWDAVCGYGVDCGEHRHAGWGPDPPRTGHGPRD